MKKYFLAGTEDEIKFGDELELDFTRENEKTGKTVHHHMEIKFIPELVAMLLNEGVVEEHEDVEKCPLEDLEARLTDIEGRLAELENLFIPKFKFQFKKG